MKSESLLHEGRIAYDNGDFTKALAIFNQAVGRGSPSIKLLDSVAATHVRLGALDAALAAAKKIIQTNREDATGYLRAGHILLKMERASTALEIYAYGLKSIKHVGSGFENLKRAHDNLLQQQAPKNSVDPLTMLPRELAIAVLEYLNFQQRIGICRVSKGWTKFIRSEPTLWTHLDLSGAKKKVRTSFVSTAINVARTKITAATLDRLYDFDKVLAALVRHCSLESLQLANTGFQAQNLVDGLKNASKLKEFVILPGTEINPKVLRRILECCQSRMEVFKATSLPMIDFSDHWRLHLPLLRSFNLQADNLDGAPQVIADLVSNSPLLQSLALCEMRAAQDNLQGRWIDFRSSVNLKSLDLRLYIRSQRAIQLPSSMRVLKLATSLGLDQASDFFSEDGGPIDPDDLNMAELPHLEEVHLNFPGLKFHRAAMQFNIEPSDQKKGLSMLKSFWIQNCIISNDVNNVAFGLCGRLLDLNFLGITDCLSLGDEHVDMLLRDGKMLETLILSGTSITGVAIRSVVKAGHVKRLVINDCTKVSRDAVDWAQVQGLDIQFKTSNVESGGKRVRY